jgi:chemotaxis signal transduction protein
LTLDELLADLDGQVARTWSALAAPAAAPAEAPAGAVAGERGLLVTFAGRRFAVPARAVLAVSELPPVAAVPFSPPWLRGLARTAGGVVAVIDLARLLSTGASFEAPAEKMPRDGEAQTETLLVVRTSDASLDAGLAVRGIARLVSLAGSPGRPPAPGELGPCRSTLVAGLVPDPTATLRPPVAVLDVDRLLHGAHEELHASANA